MRRSYHHLAVSFDQSEAVRRFAMAKLVLLPVSPMRFPLPTRDEVQPMRARLLLLLALLEPAIFCFADGSAAVAEEEGRRVALVIGNADYQYASDLSSPANDAASVAEGLRRAGFSVIATNVGRHDMEIALNQFLRTASGASLTLFYYSGHGIQAGGFNRIIPTDAMLRDVADLDVETFAVDTILRAMEKQGGVQLMFLDACRNNPFAGRDYYVGTVKARGDAGFAPFEAHRGRSLLGFSTEPGQVALDGNGELSPYTQAFVHNVLVPGTDLLTGLRKVRQEVARTTGGNQIPWESHSLVDAVYLMPKSSGAFHSGADNPKTASMN